MYHRRLFLTREGVCHNSPWVICIVPLGLRPTIRAATELVGIRCCQLWQLYAAVAWVVSKKKTLVCFHFSLLQRTSYWHLPHYFCLLFHLHPHASFQSHLSFPHAFLFTCRLVDACYWNEGGCLPLVAGLGFPLSPFPLCGLFVYLLLPHQHLWKLSLTCLAFWAAEGMSCH